MRRTARWRMAPSVMRRMRESSSSVSGPASKLSRWYVPSPLWAISYASRRRPQTSCPTHLPPAFFTRSRARLTISSCRFSGSSGSSMSKISYAITFPETLPSLGLNRPRRRASLGNTRRDDEAGSGGQCSIAAVKGLLAWLLGAFALLGFLRRRREPAAAPAVDPRAEELRRKLEESRTIVEDRDEVEGAERSRE